MVAKSFREIVRKLFRNYEDWAGAQTGRQLAAIGYAQEKGYGLGVKGYKLQVQVTEERC